MNKRSLLAIFLKDKRVAAGISQDEIAKHLGYGTAQFISNWERGVSLPPVTAVKKIAAKYHISAEDLFERILSETISTKTKELRQKWASANKPKQIMLPGLR